MEKKSIVVYFSLYYSVWDIMLYEYPEAVEYNAPLCQDTETKILS